jgi:hypothetical protein
MKNYNKTLLQEIYRINELLGTQIISEGVIDDIVRVIINDPGSYANPIARRNLNNALFSAAAQGRNLDFATVANDLWKLTANSPELIKKVTDDIFATQPTLRTQFDVLVSNPKWKGYETSEIPGLVDNYIDDAYAGLPNITEGYKNFLKKRLADEIIQSVTKILTKEQEDLMKILLKNNDTFWDKIFINGNKIAEQVKSDLDILSNTKFVKDKDAVLVRKRVQENLKKLIDWRRSTYENLVHEINAIVGGQTNYKNAYRWTNLIDTVKKEFGDWTLLDNIAKNKTTWNAVLTTILDGFYNANKQLINAVLFVPRMIADSKFFTGKAVETLTQTTVKASQKPEATQTLGKSVLNWLTVYTPRGWPREKNIKNFQDVYNIAGKWGMISSYTIELITRAYKTAAYIVAAQNLWEWITAGTNRIDEVPEKKRCNEEFVSIIKQNDFSAEEAAEFLVNQFKPETQPTLPCIVSLNMTDDDLTEFMAVALYRSKGTGLWAFIQRVLEATWIRIKDDPLLGGPPVISIPTLFSQFGEKSIFAVIQENMPAIDTAEIRREGPVPTNGTPSPTPTPSPVPNTGGGRSRRRIQP